MGTYIVGGIIAIVVVLIIRKMIADNKKSSCSGSCGSCKKCH